MCFFKMKMTTKSYNVNHSGDTNDAQNSLHKNPKTKASRRTMKCCPHVWKTSAHQLMSTETVTSGAPSPVTYVKVQKYFLFLFDGYLAQLHLLLLALYQAPECKI